MIDPSHDLSITSNETLNISRWQSLLSATSGVGDQLEVMQRLDRLRRSFLSPLAILHGLLVAEGYQIGRVM